MPIARTGLRAVVVALALLAVAVLLPAPAAQADGDVDVYTTPGYHTVNGRQWHTTCGPYSSTITRCRAEIWATQVSIVNGKYVKKTGWVFNNLTYLPAPRSAWIGNPLATAGSFVVNGRQWKTECDNATTGPNACRSYTWSKVIESVRTSSGTTYRTVSKWVFNNIVMFTDPPAATCPGAELPAGYGIANGRPHAIATPYADNTLYNPTSISQFIRAAMDDPRNTAAEQTCLAVLGGNALLAGAISKPTPDGATALWYPYMFDFSANPAIPTLKAGWISGLAQGSALGSLSLLSDLTGDPKWLTAAEQTFESFTVPLADGGFTHEVNGALWFEEYPTAPPTTVLNGNMEAVISLDLWQRRSDDPRAADLFQRSIAGLKEILPEEQVPITQGMLSSYDQVRGYAASPIRVATGSALTVHSATQDLPTGPKPLALTAAAPAHDGANILANSTFSSWTNGLPTGWSRVLGSAASFKNASGAVAITGNGTGSQTLGQTVAASKVTPGATYRLSWRGKTAYPAGVDGTSGRVVVVAICSGVKSTIGKHNVTRAHAFAQFDMLVKVPSKACSLQVQLYQADPAVTSTTVTYDDVTLTPAQPTANAVNVVWPLSVQDAPTSTVTVTYTGVGEVQVYDQGRWWSLAKLSSTSPATVTVTVPERFTGRNLHYGYHETHIDELVSLYRRTADPVFLEFAQAWRPLAPSKEHLFNDLSTYPYLGPDASPSARSLATPLDESDSERLSTDEIAPELGSVPDIGVPVPVSPTGTGQDFD